MASIRSFADKDYVIGYEIGLREEGGQLQNLLDFATSPKGLGKGIGMFAAVGDLHKWDNRPMMYVSDSCRIHSGGGPDYQVQYGRLGKWMDSGRSIASILLLRRVATYLIPRCAC
jgi:hypothetical protein